MLGAIAEAGGASLLTFWLIVWVELDSLMFRLVLSDLLLFSFTFLLSVLTSLWDVDWLTFVFWLVLFEVLLFVLFTFWLTVELTVELDVEVLTLLFVFVLFEVELAVEVFTFVFKFVFI